MIVHPFLLQFRAGFHEALRDELAERGVELQVVHGFPHGKFAAKQDWISLEWAEHVENRVFTVAGRELYWTPARARMRGADLVIISQQSKQLIGYELFLRQVLGRQRMAYWGHGRNLDEQGRSRIGEAVKKAMSRHVHWWFAYTAMTARIVEGLGFPPERITNVQNSIDTQELKRHAASLRDADIAELRDRLRIESDNVGLYIGGMYEHKRLPYLIDACQRIREQVPDFHAVFLGAGPDRHLLDEAARRHPWMHLAGPRFGREKVGYFALAKLLLMPGRVGLAIVDSFALGTPLVSVADSVHSPEIEYLEAGRNGMLLPPGSGPGAYADAVARLLRDEDERKRLVEGALASGSEYTIENMARRFADGVEQALRA